MASSLVPASLANRLSESERARIDHEAPPIIDGSPPSQNRNLLRQASTSAAFVRKASSRAWEAGVSSPVRELSSYINNSSGLDSGVDVVHPAKPACMLLGSFVFILGLVAGLVAFEYYLLVEPLHWIVRERFEVTKGWAKSVCTVVTQRCELDCTCCDSCSGPPGMFLSDNCLWLDQRLYERDHEGRIHSPSRTRSEDDSQPSSFVGDEVPGKGHNRRYGGKCKCDRFVKIAMTYRIGAPCDEQDSACQAEHFEPKVPHPSVERGCKSVKGMPVWSEGKEIAGSTACSSPQINVNKNSDVYEAQCLSYDAMPECNPQALNRKGKAIDCWLRPNVNQSQAGSLDIRFHDSADIPVWAVGRMHVWAFCSFLIQLGILYLSLGSRSYLAVLAFCLGCAAVTGFYVSLLPAGRTRDAVAGVFFGAYLPLTLLLVFVQAWTDKILRPPAPPPPAAAHSEHRQAAGGPDVTPHLGHASHNTWLTGSA